MATYAVGDIQGCFDALQYLLDKISFDPNNDTLWFAGDLVNRGDKSLETLRYIKNLGDSAISVLGNHDLTLLALSEGACKVRSHTLDDIFAAPDREELIYWLRHQALFHHDAELKYSMLHAGIPPQWTIKKAQSCALEVESVLQGEEFSEFMHNMFGNKPKKWHKDLQGWARLRFITNCFTRMRYCKPGGKLNFKDKGVIGSQKKGFIPWYETPHRKTRDERIIFGHWSTLFGQSSNPNVYPLDTGCLWGGRLTAMRLDTKEPEFFSISCDKPKKSR